LFRPRANRDFSAPSVLLCCRNRFSLSSKRAKGPQIFHSPEIVRSLPGPPDDPSGVSPQPVCGFHKTRPSFLRLLFFVSLSFGSFVLEPRSHSLRIAFAVLEIAHFERPNLIFPEIWSDPSPPLPSRTPSLLWWDTDHGAFSLLLRGQQQPPMSLLGRQQLTCLSV